MPIPGTELPPPCRTSASSEVPTQFQITLQVDQEFMKLLEQAQAISGAFKKSEALKKALKLYVEKKSPKERKPEARTKKAFHSRYIAKSTKEKVFAEARRRCMYVSPAGVRCSETHGLQIEHCKPYGLGGGSDESNLRVLCRAHNGLMAERVYGKEKILRCRHR
jgi:hypothetical protein